MSQLSSQSVTRLHPCGVVRSAAAAFGFYGYWFSRGRA